MPPQATLYLLPAAAWSSAVPDHGTTVTPAFTLGVVFSTPITGFTAAAIAASVTNTVAVTAVTAVNATAYVVAMSVVAGVGTPQSLLLRVPDAAVGVTPISSASAAFTLTYGELESIDSPDLLLVIDIGIDIDVMTT